MSHRGDSGNHGTVAKRIMMKTNWKARGTRHAAEPPMKLKSRSVSNTAQYFSLGVV
jgi:hypothetical protein